MGVQEGLMVYASGGWCTPYMKRWAEKRHVGGVVGRRKYVGVWLMYTWGGFKTAFLL